MQTMHQPFKVSNSYFNMLLHPLRPLVLFGPHAKSSEAPKMNPKISVIQWWKVIAFYLHFVLNVSYVPLPISLSILLRNLNSTNVAPVLAAFGGARPS